MIALYFHIPYCVRKCRYCDFCSVPRNESADRYPEALQTEIALRKKQYPGETARTVFFGGGTPTVLDASTLGHVLERANAAFPFASDAEISIECNPKTVSKESLQILRAAGFNRLSIGLQSADDLLLERIGRVHTYADFLHTYAWARETGFDQINVDLMHGLPGQQAEQYLETLDRVMQLGPEHISAYSLILEEGTPLYDDCMHGRETLPDEDAVADMQDAGIDAFERGGYSRYEVSNFAKPGFACRHNLTYWNNEPYLGFGVAAHSSMPTDGKWYRFANVESIPTYLKKLESGRLAEAERILINTFEQMFETIMLGLRKTEGVRYDAFCERFGCDLRDVYPEAIAKNRARCLWRESDESLCLNRRGMDLMNSVLLDFRERNYWDLLRG